MGSDTRLLPSRKPMSTGIAQTQLVNRPATFGVGNNIPPVTASPAASRAVRAQVSGNPMARNAAATNGRTRLPGPPGSAVASVELLPNVTKGVAGAGGSVKVIAPPLADLSTDELMLVSHLLGEFAGNPDNESSRELAEGAVTKIAAILAARV